MKRSEINRRIEEAIDFIGKAGIVLPYHAHWNFKSWYQNGDLAEELRKRAIGWNITDFGSDNFLKTGVILYTPSNGIFDPVTNTPLDQTYAHRYFILRDGQEIMTEHHATKIEDIIVFAGAELKVELHNVGPNEELDTAKEVRIMRNRIWESCTPGTVITLVSGERIRFEPRHYHRPWGYGGAVLVEEVSMVTDDLKESRHLPEAKPMVFAQIEEDAQPIYLLCTELPGTTKFDQLVERYLK
jgi:D-lyxose ketol-isomerase